MTTAEFTLDSVPPGFWALDEHTTAPPGTLHNSVFVESLSDGFTRAFACYGIPGARVAGIVVDGWVYTGFQPLTDPEELGRRVQLTTTTDMIGLMRDRANAYLERGRALEDDRRRLARSISGLDDDALANRIGEIAARTRDVVSDRFADIVVGSLATEYIWAAGQELGWDEATALARLGRVPANAAVFHSLTDAAAALVASHPEVVDHIRSDTATLDEVTGALDGTDVGAALDRDLEIGFEASVASPPLRERPDVLLDALARLLDSPLELDDHGAPNQEPLPDALSDVADMARLALRWRDESHNTINRWLALVRTVALEAGRRLAERGILTSAEHALDLDDVELTRALRSEHGSDTGDHVAIGAVAAERNAERDRRARRMPPPVLGKPPSAPPGPPPGVELPPAFERNAARVMWLTSHIATPPPAPPGNGGGHGAGHGGHAAHNGAVGLTGVGASPGLVEGPARVLRGVDDFDRFEPGDVVVCAVTSPAWDPLLASASAVVTDTGGLAGHAAITARELGLPAVVGTGAATATITDGQLLRVDGSAGTVEVVTT